jgi:hypothetical protein
MLKDKIKKKNIEKKSKTTCVNLTNSRPRITPEKVNEKNKKFKTQ